ncbi:MAG: YqaJ viral recombinase family protein [Planctomycetaceae bacterium]|nr:YqaJ viral recombinase family protein [Planctomycetaceae bacterium]
MSDYDPATCAERLGKLTASKAGVIMGGLETSGLATYVKRLAWERFYGVPAEDIAKTAAMDRGNELEAAALDWYEFETDSELLRTPGFMAHPVIECVGASPDAVVYFDQGPIRTAQCKCPLSAAWMEVKRTLKVPAEYRWQCKWEAWVVGVPAFDFFVWHPVAGGIIVAGEVTTEECEQMAERAAVVDGLVQKWVEILTERAA